MNTKELIQLLNQPKAINTSQLVALEAIIYSFPYFQPARAIHLKGLYDQDSFQYNQKLKETAAYTTDRSILFDFITSQDFNTIVLFPSEDKNTTSEEEEQPAVPEIISETSSIGEEYKLNDTTTKENVTNEESDATKISLFEEKLEIGKPLQFTISEKHSFEEWLQLTQLKPVQRTEQPSHTEPDIEENPTFGTDTVQSEEKIKKQDIIDKFIESNPRISPKKEYSQNVNIITEPQDSSQLMTETLAKIYLEQKKYQKAIQAYEILILKYPEKSYFFADRITEIKKLQQNNND